MSRIRQLAMRGLELGLSSAGAYRALLRVRAFESRRYGEPEIHLLPRLVNSQRTAIDVGAADGVYSYHLCRLARRVIAFEPNPHHYAMLKASLRDIEIYHAALSSDEGAATLRIPVVSGVPYRGWATIEPKNSLAEVQPHSVEEIEVKTMVGDRLDLGDVGFIKIDVEGHEHAVLMGLRNTLRSCRPNLLIEVGAGNRGGSLEQIKGLLGLDYEPFVLNGEGSLVAAPPEIDATRNVIFLSSTSSQISS